MDLHIAAVCRSGYYHLRLLRPLTRSLSSDAAETVVHAFIASRLDYPNTLLYSVSDKLMRRLQSVQNAAARLVTGARRCEHITPILRQLHWLPVRQRVLFKDRCPCVPMSGRPSTIVHHRTCQTIASLPLTPDRSSNSLMCVVRRAHNMYGERCFATAGPRVRNSLPAEQCDSLMQFKRCLKTFLFGSWDYCVL